MTTPSTAEQFNFASRDILGADVKLLELEEGTSPYVYEVRKTNIPGVWYWKAGIFTTDGGTNKRQGDFNRDFDRTASSTLDTRFPRTLSLPLRPVAQTTADPAGSLAGIHHCRGLSTNTLFIGCGSTDDAALFYESSGTITAITGAGTAGRPGSAITCLVNLPSNGGQIVLLGRAGAAPVSVTDTSGTIGHTGHASLNPTWGAVSTPYGYNLFYANAGWWTQPDTGNITAAPTQSLSGIRNGGYVLGILKRGGGPARCYYWVPRATNTSGGLLYGSEVVGDVYSVNLEGYDNQPVNFDPYLPYVTWAAILDEGILASDGRNLVWNNAKYNVPLHEFRDRNLAAEGLVRGAACIGRDCYVRAQGYAGVVQSRFEWWDYLDLDKFRWHQISATSAVTWASAGSVLPGGSLPWSFNGQNPSYMYTYRNTEWARLEWLQNGVNPYSLSGSVVGAGLSLPTFATSGSWTGPQFQLPGLEGKAKVVRAIHYLNNPAHAGGFGGTLANAGSVKWEEVQSGLSKTFYALENVAGASQFAPDNMSVFDVFEPKCTITQGASSADGYTADGIPVIFEGWAADDRSLIASLGIPPTDLAMAGR